MTEASTRDRIVEAADALFYEQGFESASFGDIAAAVGISRGNIHHHFKSKDEILAAVIERRLASTEAMLKAWEAQSPGPEERIASFIDILIANRAKIMSYGCPVGALCVELAKLDHAALPAASAIFTLFRDWLRRQFELLGREAEADELAMHALMRSQGVATLAAAFKDESYIRREVVALREWLRAQAVAA